MARARDSGLLQHTVTLAVFATALAVGPPRPAGAQAVPSAATTQGNARRQGVITTGNVSWNCVGSRCTTSTMPSAIATAIVACQGLAREVGVITALTVAKRAFTAGELQQCNGVTPAAALTAVPLTKAVAGTVAAPAATPATPAARTYPMNIRTVDLTVTGIGHLTERVPFATKSARTAELTVTGTGRLAEHLPFTPKSIRTAELTATGTGVIR